LETVAIKRLLAEVPEEFLKDTKKGLIDLGVSMKDFLPVVTNHVLKLGYTPLQLGVPQETHDKILLFINQQPCEKVV
jgi:pyruvate/oxaloacetate carboxyltransferase